MECKRENYNERNFLSKEMFQITDRYLYIMHFKTADEINR